MADKPMSRRELGEKIVARAWKDEAFRKSFLADPKKAFEAKLGTKLPPNLSISAFAEDENHLHFVIPAKPKGSIAELSDADLEKVAGGLDIVVGTLIASAAAFSAAAGSIASAAITVKSEGW